jgi:hypothetical protein
MPSLAYWVAVDLVNRRTAPLEAPYAPELGPKPPTNPTMEEMLIIDPPPA